MKKLLALIILAPLIGYSHPGVGIVKDSKGNIFYTDLQQVWKISNGIKKIIVPNVHSHELYIDKNDNLFGEGGIYDAAADKHYHYLWVYKPDGSIDTVMGLKEANIHQDFSLARDKQGNEYYIKQYLTKPDTTHLYKKSPGGVETVLATGNFKGVTWLHPQQNGTILFTSRNNIYRIDTLGQVRLLKEGIGNKTPSFQFSGNNITVWGIWEDDQQNVFVAVFSDQTVKRIDTNGNVTDYYHSTGNWTPLHGVFDNNNRLWVLEGSDKNEVRVTLAETPMNTKSSQNKRPMLSYVITGFLLLSVLFLFFKLKKHYFPNLKSY